jgi:hypothetical protein
VCRLRIRPTASTSRSTRWFPTIPNKPYNIKELIIKVVRRWRLLRTAARVRQEYRHRLCPHGRFDGWYRRQPAVGACRLSRHQEFDQGCPLRSLLRCLQHSGDHLRRRAGLHAGYRPGVRRHHQARRQAALRLRRVHGTQDYRHHPQGLRRCLRRHGFEAPARRRQLCLAIGRDRGHGAERARSRSSSARRRTIRPSSPRARRSTRRSLPTPSSPAHAGSSTTSSCRTRRASASAAHWRCCATRSWKTRGASTATFRSDTTGRNSDVQEDSDRQPGRNCLPGDEDRQKDGHPDGGRLFRSGQGFDARAARRRGGLYWSGSIEGVVPGDRQDHRRLQADRCRSRASGLRLPVGERGVLAPTRGEAVSSSSARSIIRWRRWATKSPPRRWLMEAGVNTIPGYNAEPSATPLQAVVDCQAASATR